MKRIVLVTLVSCGLQTLGCHDDTSNPSPGDVADTSRTDDSQIDDTSEVGGARDGAEVRDTVSSQPDDTAPLDPRARDEQLVQFIYQRVTSACQVGTCTEGVGVQLISKDLLDINPATRLDEPLESSDYQRLESLLTDEIVLRKMKRGWQCGDERTYNQEVHQFRARFRFSDVDRPQIRTISGCMPIDAPYRDGSRVRRIVDTLQNMKSEYFDE